MRNSADLSSGRPLEGGVEQGLSGRGVLARLAGGRRPGNHTIGRGSQLDVCFDGQADEIQERGPAHLDGVAGVDGHELGRRKLQLGPEHLVLCQKALIEESPDVLEVLPDLPDRLADDGLEFPGPGEPPVSALDREDELGPVLGQVEAGRSLHHPGRFRPGLEAEACEERLLDREPQVPIIEIVLGDDDGIRRNGQRHFEGRHLAQPRIARVELEGREPARGELARPGGRRFGLHPRGVESRARIEPRGDGLVKGQGPLLGPDRQRHEEKDKRDADDFTHGRPPKTRIR